ncbi:hypothetical protein Ancab_024882 [Ancistrocladus abbreviatus]
MGQLISSISRCLLGQTKEEKEIWPCAQISPHTSGYCIQVDTAYNSFRGQELPLSTTDSRPFLYSFTRDSEYTDDNSNTNLCEDSISIYAESCVDVVVVDEDDDEPDACVEEIKAVVLEGKLPRKDDGGFGKVEIVLCKESFIEIEKPISAKGQEGTRKGPYTSSQKMLLVGEGDFSFSACLAVAFGTAANMVATSLDSREFLLKNYRKAMRNILELTSRGCTVMHGIDATKMASHHALHATKFDRIIFNFPHTGIFRNSSVSPRSRIRNSAALLRLLNEDASRRGEGKLKSRDSMGQLISSISRCLLGQTKEEKEIWPCAQISPHTSGYCIQVDTAYNSFCGQELPLSTTDSRPFSYSFTRDSEYTDDNSDTGLCEDSISICAKSCVDVVVVDEDDDEPDACVEEIKAVVLEGKWPLKDDGGFGKVEIVICKERFIEIEKPISAKGQEETRKGPYTSSQKMLLVGEGDFSFSACLAVAFGTAANMVATSLDSREFLLKNYSKAMWNILELTSRGCMVMHGVDATKMTSHHGLHAMKFDRIIFNFPHAGIFRNSGASPTSQIRQHQRLVSMFLENAKRMIKVDGEIHVTHKSNGFFQQWKIPQLAVDEGLHLIEAVRFNHRDYQGYSTKFGFGGDMYFNCNPSNTYKFGLMW